MLGVAPVPLPQVMMGWQRPPWAKSAGRNSVNCGGAPPSTATPAVGPTFSSVTVANGPATAGSAAGHVPTVHAPDAPASMAPPPWPPASVLAPAGESKRVLPPLMLRTSWCGCISAEAKWH